MTNKKPNPELFLHSLQKYGVKAQFDHSLHVTLFFGDWGMTSQVRAFFAEQPELEAALLELFNHSFCGIGRENILLRAYLYNLITPCFEIEDEALNKMERHCKYYWLCVMKWLSRNGGEVPNLPGAVRYVLGDEDARLDTNTEKFPASFPKGNEEWYTQKTLLAL